MSVGDSLILQMSFGDFLPSDTDPTITQSHNAEAAPERKINFFPITCSIIWEALSLGLGLARISGQAMPQKKVFFSDYRSFERKVKASFVKWTNGQHRDTRILGVENTEAKSELGCISVLEDVFSIHKACTGCDPQCRWVHTNMHMCVQEPPPKNNP